MSQSLKIFAKKALMSLSISAGLLAIANMDAMLSEQRHSLAEVEGQVKSEKNLLAALQAGKSVIPKVTSESDKLRDSLAQDEINDQNPFAALTELSGLSRLTEKGVVKFHRQTLRSPRYRAETGYDLVHYSVEHTDGTLSSVVAYQEGGYPVVMILIGQGDRGELYRFQSGNLTDQATLPLAQAQGIIDRRLSESIPFLSVSR